MSNKKHITATLLWYCFILSIVFLPLVSCTKEVPLEGTTATVEITAIVDKLTKAPITKNKITLVWTDLDGNIINSDTQENRETLRTELISDGSQRLLIKVEAVGYIPVELAVRFSLKPTKI